MFEGGILDKVRVGASKAKAHLGKHISSKFISGSAGGVIGWFIGKLIVGGLTQENPFASDDPRWLGITDITNASIDIFIAGMTGVAIETGSVSIMDSVDWSTVTISQSLLQGQIKVFTAAAVTFVSGLISRFKDYMIHMFWYDELDGRVDELIRDLAITTISALAVGAGVIFADPITNGIDSKMQKFSLYKRIDNLAKRFKFDGAKAVIGLATPVIIEGFIAGAGDFVDHSDGM